MRSMLSALFLTGATVAAVAQVPVFAGAGMGSCAEFAEFYRRDPRSELDFFQWAQGYMSAINEPLRARDEPTRNLMGMPIASQKQHLRAFCDQRPLSNFLEAVRSLYLSLPGNPLKSQTETLPGNAVRN